MANANHQLVVRHVVRQYDPPAGPVVLKDVSFDARAGEAIAIVGPSGSGKSTLLNIIGSLDKPTAGTVQLGDTIVTDLSGEALTAYRAKCVGFVFQDHHLLPQLTVLENVLLPSLAIQSDTPASNRAADLLGRVGLLDRAGAFPSELSGGERQRVAVARAMMNGPAMLLGDEPTGNLDRDTGMRTVDLFLELARRDGVIVLMVTHNLELARRCDRVLELRGGEVKA